MRASRVQISAAEQPILQQIQAERKANLAKAQQQMGFAKAAAALLTGIAPRVQDTYSNAANADAGYARGLGNNVQADIAQRASANNDFLTKMGTPAAGLEHPADVGGTAYGLEGYIPATTLQREGAAFGSAAQMLPGDTLRQGQQQASATLNDTTNIAKLQEELGKLAATQPEVYQHLLSTLSEMGYRNAEVKLSAGRLGLARQSLASENAYRNASLNLRAQTISNEQAYRVAELSLKQQSMKQAWARIGISEKSLQLRATATEAKKQGGGFTPDELVHIKGKAGTIAQNAHDGMKLSDGTPDKAHPPLAYKQALKQEILAGIPPSIAIQSLKQAGYKLPIKGNGEGMFAGLAKAVAGLGGGGKHGPLGGAVESALGARIVGLAHKYLGTPYVWGGESRKGFDCSGFAQYLYRQVGVNISRTTYTQWKEGRAVRKNQLQPGDLVFFRGSDSVGGLPGHVGVYVGHGMMIDAPHTGASVRVESVFNFGGYMGARRYGK
jgi:cell wall-associated NlpC family hydrolase